jgi:hypothetical protein
MVCFFDPAALPSDFETRMQKDAFETMEKMASQGRVGWVKTGADGGYLFHFYINSQIPADLQKHCQDQQTSDLFYIPSGVVWACGTEFAALNPTEGNAMTPKGGLGKYTHMGARFEIAPGEYTLSVWRTDWPEDAIDQALEKVFGKDRVQRERRLARYSVAFLFCTVIATFAVVILSLNHRSPWLAWAWLAVVLAWVVSVKSLKMAAGTETPERRAVELEFPSIVVQMMSKPRH